jgi:EmrB/QacA subfamily drug resistance transporter
MVGPRMTANVPERHGSRWILAAVLGATFMLLMDLTIVQVALPSIRQDLDVDFTLLRWVIDAYALSLATLILTAGSLADRFGRKRVFVLGVSLFTLASLLCGVATGGAFLSVARGVQGIGGAAMFATSLALIAQEFSGPARRKAIAAWSATVGVAVAVGPVLGGALTDGLGWRWIFFVNLPVGLAVVAITVRRTVNIGDPHARHADVAGLVTFSGALFLFVFALLRATDLGWGSATIVGCFTGSAVALAAFVLVELRQPRPMFDLTLFRKPAFVGVSVGMAALGMGMFGLMPYITIYLQNVLDYSPLQGGLRMLPIMIFAFAVPLVSPRLLAGLPPGAVAGCGLLLVTGGLVYMHGVRADSHWTTLLGGMILMGIGVGLANPAIAHVALGVVPPQRSGMASGINNTCRIAGLATGVAALGAILQSRISSRLGDLMPGAPRELANAIASGGTHAAGVAGGPHAVYAARVAFVSGLNATFLVGAAVLLFGSTATLALVRSRDLLQQAPAPQPASASEQA